MDSGVNTVTVHIKGPGSGREAAGFGPCGLRLKVNFTTGRDADPATDARPPKRRRV